MNWDEFDLDQELNDLETLGFDFTYICKVNISKNNNIITNDFYVKLFNMFKEYDVKMDTKWTRKEEYINVEKGYGVFETIQTMVYYLTLKGKKSKLEKCIEKIKTIPLQHYDIPLTYTFERV